MKYISLSQLRELEKAAMEESPDIKEKKLLE